MQLPKNLCWRVAAVFGLLVAPLAGQSTAPSTRPPAESGGKRPPAFFRAEKRHDRWWLIDPNGQPFISKGVAGVQFAADLIQHSSQAPYREGNIKRYGGYATWREVTVRRLVGWGFNTLGAWSDDGLAQVEVDGERLAAAPILNVGARFVSTKLKEQAWVKGIFPDVFDPDFVSEAQEIARERCAPHKDDPWVVGWFTDNELRWGPDWRGKDELLTMFLALPEASAGRKAAIKLLHDRYGEIAKFNWVWRTDFPNWEGLAAAGAIASPVAGRKAKQPNDGSSRSAKSTDLRRVAINADCEAFVAELAERYFRITADAIRAADPNHMILGCRFAQVPAEPVVAAAAKHVDVISCNAYGKDPRWSIDQYSASDKPLIIGEFSMRGRDSGLPNTKGSGPIVTTQAERADAFAQYVKLALSQPNVVGYHWFAYVDEPREGRFDGENSNVGVVTIDDEIYDVLTRRMTKVNAQAEALHSR